MNIKVPVGCLLLQGPLKTVWGVYLSAEQAEPCTLAAQTWLWGSQG